MTTEREAWYALALECNRLGRMGWRVKQCGIIVPTTAANDYAIWIDKDRGPETATEDW